MNDSVKSVHFLSDLPNLGQQSPARRTVKEDSYKPKFSCEYCGKLFIHLSKLKRHLPQHTDERAFKCDICEKSFKRKDTMQEHRMVVHMKNECTQLN